MGRSSPMIGPSPSSWRRRSLGTSSIQKTVHITLSSKRITIAQRPLPASTQLRPTSDAPTDTSNSATGWGRVASGRYALPLRPPSLQRILDRFFDDIKAVGTGPANYFCQDPITMVLYASGEVTTPRAIVLVHCG